VILCDINVLIYAFRDDSRNHQDYNAWLNSVLNSDESYGVSDSVLSGFIRIVSHPRIFPNPTPLSEALEFAQFMREQSNAVHVNPSPRHWEIFIQLCEKTQARGSHVADAFFAALAIDSGCEWITEDRDYSRYPGLRWRHPLE
jgi:uncharacterized protein